MHASLAVGTHAHVCTHAVAMQILGCGSVVVVLSERSRSVSRGVYFVDAIARSNLRRIVVGIGHRYNGVGLYKYRNLPQRRVILVHDASALVSVAVPIVYPSALRQINSVANVVALLVHTRLLVDRRHEQRRTEHKLILGLCAMRVVVGIVKEHGSYHRLAVNSLVGQGVGIGHEHRLKLEVRAVDACCRLAQDVRILGVGSPSVHVELHGREGLPLKLAHVYRNVLASKYSIHVARDVGLTRQARTNERWDVKAYVFPIATRLVAAPNRSIALGSGPSVERDDEWTRVRTIIRHYLSHIGHTVQSERIAVAHPRHICL